MLDIDFMIEILPRVLKASLVTLEISFLSLFFSVTLGLIFSIIALTSGKLINILIRCFVEFTRGVPQLVQISIIYFALPYIGIYFDEFWTGVVALSFIGAGYTIEIFRNAVLNVNKGQHEAGKILGLSNYQTLIYVLYPQIIKRSLPPITNELINVVKASALLSVISVNELTKIMNDVIFEYGGTETLFISNSSGDAVIQSTVQDKDIIFKGNDGGAAITALTLDMSAAGKLISTGGAAFSADVFMSDNELYFADNGQARFGTGEDLKIYHDGSHSFIEDGGTGNLKILASVMEINNAADDEAIASFTADGAVELRHNNSAKFSTTAAGASITGKALASEGIFTGGVSPDYPNVLGGANEVLDIASTHDYMTAFSLRYAAASDAALASRRRCDSSSLTFSSSTAIDIGD